MTVYVVIGSDANGYVKPQEDTRCISYHAPVGGPAGSPGKVMRVQDFSTFTRAGKLEMDGPAKKRRFKKMTDTELN